MIGLANRSPDDEYTVAAIAAASRAVIVLGPVFAIWAALRMSSVNEYLARHRPTRNLAVVAIESGFWPVVAGPIAAMAAVASSARVIPSSMLELSMFAIVGLQVLASAVLGLCIGRVAPAIVALPFAGLASYFWLALMTSTDWATLRYLTGSFATCCTIDQEPASSMVRSSFAFAIALSIGLIWWLSLRSSRRVLRNAGVPVLVAAAVVIGFVTARSGAAEPSLLAVEDRNVAVVCDEIDGIDLCLWPEHTDLRATAGPVLAKAVRSLEAAGIASLGQRISERPLDDALHVQVARAATAPDLQMSLVLDLLPSAAACSYDSKSSYNVYATHDLALAWLAGVAGMRDADLKVRVDEQTLTALVELRHRSERQQLDWFLESRVKLMRDCDVGGS